MADEAQAKEDKKDAKPAAEGGGAVAPTEGGEAAPAGASKKRTLLLAAFAALAVVGVGVAVGVLFFMGGEDKKQEEGKDATTVEAAVVDVPEFTINMLSEDENATHFMKIKLAVELAHKTDVANTNVLLPRLQDDWNTFLRQMRPGDMQGSAALQRLKEGLLRRATQSLDPVPVKAVYIRELLVQ